MKFQTYTPRTDTPSRGSESHDTETQLSLGRRSLLRDETREHDEPYAAAFSVKLLIACSAPSSQSRKRSSTNAKKSGGGRKKRSGLKSYPEVVRCEEKTKLIEAYKSAVANYSTAVNDLNLTRGKISKVEYDRLLLNSETARVAAETARLDLDRHTRKHGC
jgi:hypothetical protein